MTLLRTSFISLLALAPFFVSPAISGDEEPSTVDELVTAIKATYGEVETLKADFVQTTRSATMGEQKQRGKVSVKRPKMMKWDSTAVNGPLFVTNGDKMWLYTPSDKQVLVYNDLSSAAGNTDLVNLLTNLDKMDEQFDVTMMTAEELGNRKAKAHGVKLKPKVESQYKDVVLVFSKKKYELEQVTVIDHFGVETEISFSQLKINPDIPDSDFSFEPPSGVEVINADGL